MGRPAPVRDRRDRFHVVEDETAYDDPSAVEREQEETAILSENNGARLEEREVRDWDDMIDAPAMPERPNDITGASPAMEAPVKMAIKPAARIKSEGKVSAISLILMALAAGTLSAIVVLFLF